MKKWLKAIALCILTVVAVGPVSMVKAETSTDDKAKIQELKKSYTMTTCPVSGDMLEGGSMGAPIDYLYKGKDKDGKEVVRLVRLCCNGCIKDFKKDPKKYLKTIDEASAKSSASSQKDSGGMHGM